MSDQAISWDAFLQAGRVVFGPGFDARGEWRCDLRTAYRRRALETHPDRAEALGRSPGELAREFHALQEAYQYLATCRIVPLPRPPARPRAPEARCRPTSAPAARPHAPRRHAAATAPAGGADAAAARGASADARPASAPRAAVDGTFSWRGLPRRPLRFAEFLYYSGRVPWGELVAAIAWERRQRPPVGRLAVELGFLQEADVAEILRRRSADRAWSVLFGEYAVRAGFLTRFQLLVLVGRQQRLQRPVGEFFVERGWLDAGEVEDLRRRLFFHNATCAPGAACAAA